MAPDNLKYVGKYLRESREKADFALSRYYPNYPIVERSRDVFDEAIPFEMAFKTADVSPNRIILDLFFNKPPPMRGNNFGCIHARCKQFLEPSGGNHIENVGESYHENTVTVFVNGEKLELPHYAETSPENGEIFYQGTEGPDNVTICYIMTDCPEPPETCDNIIFDPFDRTVLGGLGNHNFLLYTYSGDQSVWSVNGFEAVFTWTQASGSPEAILNYPLGPWSKSNWVFETRFKTGNWTYGSNEGFAAVRIRTDVREITLGQGSNVGFGHPHGYIAAGGVEADFDWQPLSWYTVKWFYDRLTGESKLKVWLEGDLEPTYLVTEITDDEDAVATMFKIGGTTTDFTSITMIFDWIDFLYAGKPCVDDGGLGLYIIPPITLYCCNDIPHGNRNCITSATEVFGGTNPAGQVWNYFASIAAHDPLAIDTVWNLFAGPHQVLSNIQNTLNGQITIPAGVGSGEHWIMNAGANYQPGIVTINECWQIIIVRLF